MAKVVPYIDFGGRSGEAATFYAGVFGGDAEVQSDGERVMHLDFHAGDIHFMGSDNQTDQARVRRANDYSLVLDCDSEEQLRDFHAKLVAGGTEVFAPVDGGWGAIIAHCTDQFGVTWLLNCDKPQG